ncbi:DUF1592 domain-containing protein [Fimbriiglobus ruber]|uniref:Cytochrome c domain-containing protein n=1 Tax=Fimbriiglobus ruber TaxID=1908690 RepID=A0A225DWE5_9BACT|nr:DUF1592 domain-containing protein [Fimbriiglobus ruber]OWK45711.1 Protein of unknown function DUF1592 [Fimbriiglobus ruber]
MRLPRALVLGVGLTTLGLVGAALVRVSNPLDAVIDDPAARPPYDPDVDSDDPEADLPRAAFATHVAPFLARYCVSCHSVEWAEGGVVLAFLDEVAAVAVPATWEKVSAAVRSGRMPPPGRPRPEPTEADALIAWSDRAATGNWSGRGDPGRVTLRRLNRSEYDNTIRDLVGVTVRPAADFPADDTGDGFDTNADVLSVSPILVEKYLAAAEAVVGEAANNADVWRRLTNPPAEDFVPFVLRGSPPQRADAVKGQRVELGDDAAVARAAEIDRAYYALQAFADRAFRRPVTHAEVGRLMRFVETSLANGDGFDAGFKLAVTAVLVSPHFLFRVELDPPAGPDADRRLTGFELATRLSYFLWSSMPDEALYRLAAGGKLGDARTLAGQVRRMLRDPKSRALAGNFAGQWLQTRALTEATRDPVHFPGFDADLRRAMQQETELFFDHVVREDAPVLDLLTGEYTFVNDRLARHYSLRGVSGSQFRRVSLAGTGRAGVLTHASVLTVTSGPTRTSPVKRGKWVLENVLGTPPPAAPPGVDGLTGSGLGRATTLREQLDRHRSRAECTGCHARIDPIGFGLENFDAIGAWRDHDGNAPVDATGLLPDGRTFRGPAELRAVLAEKPAAFVRCLVEKLLTYALGRSLRAADRAAVDRITRHAIRSEFKFSSLVVALVRSDPFQKRRVTEGSAP